MSTIRANIITDRLGTGAPDFSQGIEIGGTAVTGIASQAEAEAGTASDKLMTPQRTKQAVPNLTKTQVEDSTNTVFGAVSGQRLAEAIAGIGTLTLGTPVATTSGTSFDFTGIPAGVKKIDINFTGNVALSGTDNLLVQIGDSGGLEEESYNSLSQSVGAGNATSTSGFIIRLAASTNGLIGTMTLLLVNNSTNTWVATHSTRVSAGNVNVGWGEKSLTGTLDRLRILASGANTFAAGQINIIYYL
jgi:hypothetical protein